MIYNYLKYLITACIIMSCNDSESNNSSFIDCDSLTTALMELDEGTLESILNPELEKFQLLDQDNNTCLHDNNLQAITNLLNGTCENLNVLILCCGSIETLPLISELSVELDSAGIEVTRILDLRTPGEEGLPLSFEGVHF